MFSKVCTSAALVLALAFQVNAHAAVAPVLGVAGNPARSDVKRPNGAAPCGAGVNIASEIDTSKAVAANAQGVFNVVGTDFNAGADGSRSFTAKVDASGKGTNFVAATVSKNGIAAPTTVGSDPITASLPAGTKCTGGKAGNLCLVQFVSTAGFGNCVVVSQGAAAAGAAKGGAAAAAAPAKAAGAKKGGKKGKKAAGSRAARSMLAEIEARGEEAFDSVKREITSWIWA